MFLIGSDPKACHNIRDQWLRAAQSIPRNIAEGNGKPILKDKNRLFEIARGSVLECAAVHDMLMAFPAVDGESCGRGKSQLRRIASGSLTRWIQRTDRVTDAAIESECEYEQEIAVHVPRC